METDCDTSTSGYSNILSFQTDGCCEPPNNFSTNAVTDSSAILNWNSILAAQSYDLRYRAVGNTVWLTFNNAINTGIALSNLSTCTTYEAQVRTNCADNNTTTYSSLFTFTTACGSCSALPYCASAGGSVSDEWIEIVQFGDINNNSGTANSGYTDFTNLSTTVLTASTYPISVSQGYSGPAYPEFFNIWIDYNQSGTFDANELVYTATSSTSPTSNTGSITISPTALSGSTRMRVSMKYNGSSTPCESFQFGEVEDYCINIINTGIIPCEAITDLDTVSVNELDATISWSATTNNLSYEVEYREMTQANWTSLSTTNTNFQITNLQAATAYEARIKTICSDSLSSDYSNVINFNTDWTVNTQALPTDIENVIIFPNPFKNNIFININTSTTQAVQIEVFDLSGKLLLTQIDNITNGENKINLNTANLNTGMYILKIKTKKGMITNSVVKF